MPVKLFSTTYFSHRRVILILGPVCPDFIGENANFAIGYIDEHLGTKNFPHNPLLVEVVEEYCGIVTRFDLWLPREILLLSILIADLVLQQVCREHYSLA